MDGSPDTCRYPLTPRECDQLNEVPPVRSHGASAPRKKLINLISRLIPCIILTILKQRRGYNKLPNAILSLQGYKLLIFNCL